MAFENIDDLIRRADRLLASMDRTDEQREALVDQFFLKRYGRTYRKDEPIPVEIPHEQKNGDSSHKPPGTLEQLRRDYPSLFGRADDAD